MKTLSMKNQKTKFRSLDQNTLKALCDSLCDQIENVMDHFGIEYKMNNRFLSMKCPIHGGDNDGAINLYHVGDSYRGNWKCRTHGCESEFKASIIGFIRGILSHQKFRWEKHGDEITLVLKNDKGENTWYDHIRFIPKSDFRTHIINDILKK